MKQFMIIETFRPGCRRKVYERFHAQGQLLPPGLVYLDSWLEKDGDRCFQLMETDDPSLLQVWTERWKDLVSFEVIELGEKPGARDAAVHFARHAQAWNAHDLERILAHYADDVELSSPFAAKLTDRADGMLHGKAALRDYFARGLQAFPTLRFDFVRLYVGVRSCVVEHRSVSGLHSAELEFDAQGKVRSVLGHYQS